MKKATRATLTAAERKLCQNPKALPFNRLSARVRKIMEAHNDKWIQVYYYTRDGSAPRHWNPRTSQNVGLFFSPYVSYRIDPKAPVVKTPVKNSKPARTYDDIVAAARLAGINRRLEALKAAIDEYLAPLP